jgi:nucleotide-binding universal stress UspA family protein
MRVLIGYDGSPSAAAALDDLTRAGLPAVAEALVVTVRDTAWMPPASVYELVPEGASWERPGAEERAESRPRGLAAADAAAATAARRLRAAFPGWVVRSEGLAGDPAGELMRRADEWDADLVVVGSRGLSALGRLLLGSVSRKLVTASPRPVRVARPGPGADPDAPVRVLVGLGGSPDPDALIRAVGERAWPEGTQVRVVTADVAIAPASVAPVLPAVAATIAAANAHRAVGARVSAEAAATALRAKGLLAEAVTAGGEPRRALIREAREWPADTVFVGSRGIQGLVRRVRLGSVSLAIAESAPCAVEVVRQAPAVRGATARPRVAAGGA